MQLAWQSNFALTGKGLGPRVLRNRVTGSVWCSKLRSFTKICINICTHSNAKLVQQKITAFICIFNISLLDIPERGKNNLLLVGKALIFIAFVRLFGSLYCCGVGRSFQINTTIRALDFLHVVGMVQFDMWKWSLSSSTERIGCKSKIRVKFWFCAITIYKQKLYRMILVKKIAALERFSDISEILFMNFS